MRNTSGLLALVLFCNLGPAVVRADLLADPGFESYAVTGGGFLKPTSGPWTFTNDAGIVEPYSPNSSTGVLNTWSATFSAFQGQQYASTYAAMDNLRQMVSFSEAGDYRISVCAAAPDGSVTIPLVGTMSLGDGAFTFTLANTAIGDVHTVTKGSGWALYEAAFSIDKPGDYLLGVQNRGESSYFVNYDAFALRSVPEPCAFSMLAILGAVAAAAKAALTRTRHMPCAVRKTRRFANKAKTAHGVCPILQGACDDS
jgi:hypothetical protein